MPGLWYGAVPDPYINICIKASPIALRLQNIRLLTIGINNHDISYQLQHALISAAVAVMYSRSALTSDAG